MKAAMCTKYGSPEVLVIRDIKTPIPKAHDILIKNYACTVSTSDCYIRGFNISPLYKPLMGLVLGFTKPRQPVLGMDFAGEIVAIGQKVSNFSVGDQVFGFDRFGFGANAEYKRISETGIIAKKPGSISFQEAAAIPYGGLLALHYLRKGQPQRGQCHQARENGRALLV